MLMNAKTMIKLLLLEDRSMSVEKLHYSLTVSGINCSPLLQRVPIIVVRSPNV
jgi:hypothetical protein